MISILDREQDYLINRQEVIVYINIVFSHITREQWFLGGNKRTAIMVANKLLITHNSGFLLLNEESIDRFNILLNEYYESGCFKDLKEFMKSCIIDE